MCIVIVVIIVINIIIIIIIIIIIAIIIISMFFVFIILIIIVSSFIIIGIITIYIPEGTKLLLRFCCWIMCGLCALSFFDYVRIMCGILS